MGFQAEDTVINLLQCRGRFFAEIAIGQRIQDILDITDTEDTFKTPGLKYALWNIFSFPAAGADYFLHNC